MSFAPASPAFRALRSRLTAIVVLTHLCFCAAGSQAQAFELFGRKFFETEDETAVVPDAQPYTLEFTAQGADKDLRAAIEVASALAREEDRPPPGTAGLVARARGDYGRILAALYSQGRYGGSVRILVQGQPVETLRPDAVLPDPVPVKVDVEPGPLFRFGTIDIKGLPTGPMTSEDEFALQLGDWQLTQGKEARSGAILAVEGRLVELWRQRGYPKAEVVTRDIVADHRADTVDVTLAVEPGPSATLQTPAITGTERMDAGFVAWAAGLRPGEPYDPDTLKRARERLQRLGVFSSVSMVEADAVDLDGILPVTFNLSERKRRVVGGGASYSTTEGAALEAYWMHRNLFGRAESLRFDAAVSRIGAEELGDLNYALAATFRKPAMLTPDTDLTLQLAGKREFVDTYESRSVNARAGLEKFFSDKLRGTIVVNVERSFIEDAFGKNDYLIVGLPGTLDYDARDSKIDPAKGWRGTLAAEPFFDLLGTTFALATRGQVSSYVAFGERDRAVVAGRLALGSIVGGSLEDIPANRRFFLGGGGSIRGYDYRSVGPRRDDEVVGGLSFWESSLELRLRLNDSFGIVPFVDAGSAYEDPIPLSGEDVRIGAGLGIRYYTGLGPIRFDLAVPLNPGDDDPTVAFYVGLGQAF